MTHHARLGASSKNTSSLDPAARVVLLILAMCVPLLVGQGQWLRHDGSLGWGTLIPAVAATRTSVLAGTEGCGVLRSTDNGVTYSAVGPAERYVHAILPADSGIFIGTDNGVYRSIDDGMSWTPAGLSGKFVDCLTLIESDIMAGTTEGIYRSTGFGNGPWVPSGLEGADIRCFATLSSFVLAGVYNMGVYKSGDGGLTWSRSSTGLPDNWGVDALCVVGSVAYAGTELGLYRSTDFGAAWEETGFRGATTSLATIEDSVVVGSLDGLYLSTDGNLTWEKATWDLPKTAVFSIWASGSVLFAGTAEFGVLRTDDRGHSSVAPTGPIPDFVSCLTTIGPTVLAGTLVSGIYRSNDWGRSWSPSYSGLPSGMVNCIGGFGSIALCGLASGPAYIWRSTDNGLTWVSAGEPHLLAEGFGECRSGLLAGTWGDIYRSQDGGITWSVIGPGRGAASFAEGGGHLFAGSVDWGVHVSTDDGTTWKTSPSYSLFFDTRSLVLTDSFVVAGASQGIFRSSNNGESWYQSALGIPPHGGELRLVSIGNRIVLAWRDHGVFVSDNEGASWTDNSAGLGGLDVTAITLQNGLVIVGTAANGVWRRPIADLVTSAGDDEQAQPASFSLSQNYPNPFNPSTTIRYGLPGRAHVTLTVFNALGQTVATPVHGEQEAGYHEVKFDASGLSSGVYLYRLTAGSSVQTKKMAVVK